MDDALLDQLCALARIELSPAERDDFRAKFERLLGFVEVVQTYSGAGASPAGADTGDGARATAPLTLIEQLTPRRDVPQPFEWPARTVHDYRVPQVIAFSEDEG